MRVSETTELKASASDVWAFIRDVYNFAAWQPHIASVERGPKEGERLVHMKRGNTVLDRIVELDDSARKLSYGMVPGQETPPGVPKLDDMLATFIVTEAGSGCTVEYTISVTVPPEIEPMAQKGIGADITGSLEGLKKHFGEA